MLPQSDSAWSHSALLLQPGESLGEGFFESRESSPLEQKTPVDWKKSAL